MTDQPRWPGGTPVRPDGHGPGGGRFRDGGAAWAERLAAAAAARAASGPAGLMTHDQVESYLGRTDFEIVGSAGGDQGHVEFRQYSDGTKLAHKIIQETTGGVTPRRAARAEVETSIVAHAIGAPVPATVHDPDHFGGVLMQYVESRSYPPGFIPGLGAAVRVDAARRARTSPGGRLLGLLDTITGNPDRHAGNVIIDADGNPVGIDNGLAGFFHWWGGPNPDLGDVWTMTSQYGSELFRHQQGKTEQWYYSPEAIAQALQQIEKVSDRLHPATWEGIRDALVELEAMSTGTHDLGE